jgi:Acetyltransferase (GNAT) domain
MLMQPTPSRVAGDGVIAGTHSIFEQPWWLDALAPSQWQEVRVEKHGKIVGRLPFVFKKRFGLTVITQPPLTQTLGPWVDAGSANYTRRLGIEKKLTTRLIEQLPDFDVFSQHFSPHVTNWLPFYWAGYTATVQYTYRLEDLTDLDRIWKGFHEDLRRHVRNAEKQVSIEIDPPLGTVLDLNAQTFERQGRASPYSDDTLRRLDEACLRHGARRVFAAVDTTGRPQAMLYLVWDERASYALLNGRSDAVAVKGTNALLFWEAIRFASEVTEVFDFEGSMIESIEHFLRAFGGRQTPYLRVVKNRPKARAVLAGRDVLLHMRKRRR